MIRRGVARLIFLIAFTAFTPLTSAAACRMPTGKTWTNELNSHMKINIDDSGKISGTYTSSVGCEPKTPRPISGFCNGYAVTFSVDWGHCNSITTWSGTYQHRTLETLWQLVLGNKPTWHSVLTGSDKFTEH